MGGHLTVDFCATVWLPVFATPLSLGTEIRTLPSFSRRYNVPASILRNGRISGSLQSAVHVARFAPGNTLCDTAPLKRNNNEAVMKGSVLEFMLVHVSLGMSVTTQAKPKLSATVAYLVTHPLFECLKGYFMLQNLLRDQALLKVQGTTLQLGKVEGATKVLNELSRRNA
ncbi:hypothetical protein EDB89DRAFT_1994535 [Lactarius sanguifluus]|nr:hypothetical protein EDB89DRAFT_2012384 [Lactarius sanguifluus]KAH9168006.1 hypothetical protein EDB89DRAFT_1994535 [Lactarius sanguifluus]